jgi:hypothetical protein
MALKHSKYFQPITFFHVGYLLQLSDFTVLVINRSISPFLRFSKINRGEYTLHDVRFFGGVEKVNKHKSRNA